MDIEKLRELIAKTVNESLDSKIAKLEGKEPPEYITALVKAMSATLPNPQQQKSGSRAIRTILALSACRNDPERALAHYNKAYGNDEIVTKALSSSVAPDGGFLLRDEMAAEVIELLRPMSVIEQLGPLHVDLTGGTLRLPKHTAGSTGGWIGENTNLPMTQPAFGQVTMSAKKYASLVPISNDMIRRGGPNTEALVQQDMASDVATSLDIAYIRSIGTSAVPKGLYYWGDAATQLSAANSVSLANTMLDLGRCLQAMMDNNIRMIRPGWIMEPRTWRYLFTVQNANGYCPFQQEISTGKLFGYPFKVTSQIPRNLNAVGSGSDETELYFVDFADVVVGDAQQLLIEASNVAAYNDGSTTQAPFSLDQTIIRALIETDLAVRHAKSVVVLIGVRWGV